MNEDEIQPYIVKQLALGRDRNDVIMEVCKQQSLDWAQAESLVHEVETFDEDSIIKRQSPIVVLLALAVILGGFVLVTASGVALWDFIGMSSPQRVAYALNLYEVVVIFIIGIAMITGGVIGLRKVIGVFLK